MVGQGVLRECLLDSGIGSVCAIGRSPGAARHAKLSEIVLTDLLHYEDLEERLSGFDACFFCLGVSSSGISAEEYERVTYGITLAAAQTLARLNPDMTFIYVSGAGTDSSERGRIRWARVKGKTENALLRLPFRAAYMFRPGFIQPLHGIQSRTKWYRIFYRLGAPLLPVLRWLTPDSVLTTEQVGRAMIEAARHGAPKAILESKDIRALSALGNSK